MMEMRCRMPRRQRCRRICKEPVFMNFSSDEKVSEDVVVLTVDEYEVIRLVDYEKKTHEQCAQHMNISRTTVTEIYEGARYKLADYIVNGKSLRIAGGYYRVCDGSSLCCSGKCNRDMKTGSEDACCV